MHQRVESYPIGPVVHFFAGFPVLLRIDGIEERLNCFHYVSRMLKRMELVIIVVQLSYFGDEDGELSLSCALQRSNSRDVAEVANHGIIRAEGNDFQHSVALRGINSELELQFSRNALGLLVVDTPSSDNLPENLFQHLEVIFVPRVHGRSRVATGRLNFSPKRIRDGGGRSKGQVRRFVWVALSLEEMGDHDGDVATAKQTVQQINNRACGSVLLMPVIADVRAKLVFVQVFFNPATFWPVRMGLSNAKVTSPTTRGGLFWRFSRRLGKIALLQMSS